MNLHRHSHVMTLHHKGEPFLCAVIDSAKEAGRKLLPTSSEMRKGFLNHASLQSRSHLENLLPVQDRWLNVSSLEIAGNLPVCTAGKMPPIERVALLRYKRA
jgi:hypothetical protein